MATIVYILPLSRVFCGGHFDIFLTSVRGKLCRKCASVRSGNKMTEIAPWLLGDLIKQLQLPRMVDENIDPLKVAGGLKETLKRE